MDQATRLAREELLAKATGFVELGGRKRPVRFGFRQVAEFERLSGVSVLQVAAMMLALKVDTVVKGLWVSFRQQDPKINEAKICDMLDDDPRQLKVCLEEFVAAIINALPEDDEEEEEADPLARGAGGESETAGTGTSS
jgi:hypothetical protein